MSTPAGWYPDPHVYGQIRYWDGSTWTNQAALAPMPVSPSLQQVPPTTPQQQTTPGVPGFVCSLIGILFCVIPLVCIPLTIVGLVLSTRSLRRDPFGRGRALGLWGVWLGTIGLSLTVLIMMLAIPGAIQANF